MSIKAPYLPYDKLRVLADQFLQKFHPSRSVPTPIEDIVEFQCEMDIVPVPGLLTNHEIDSSLSHDQATIYVDSFIYSRRPKRYRFSLAHELAHKLLHPDVFGQLRYTTIAEWKQAVAAIDPDQYGFIEFQAYAFAGLILVPPGPLAKHYKRLESQAAEAGIQFDSLTPKEKNIIGDNLSEIFGASRDVVVRRLTKDGFWSAAK